MLVQYRDDTGTSTSYWYCFWGKPGTWHNSGPVTLLHWPICLREGLLDECDFIEMEQAGKHQADSSQIDVPADYRTEELAQKGLGNGAPAAHQQR